MSRPRNPNNARHAFQVRLPSELIDQLDREAEARFLGRNKLIELLLRDGLERLADREMCR